MRVYGDEGMTYSEEYFTEEMLDSLFHPAEITPAVVEPAPAGVVYTEDTAYDAAWDRMMQDEELKQAIEDKGFTKEQGYDGFTQMLEGPAPEEALDKNMSARLQINYVTAVEDGKHVHRIDGETILSIPTEI